MLGTVRAFWSKVARETGADAMKKRSMAYYLRRATRLDLATSKRLKLKSQAETLGALEMENSPTAETPHQHEVLFRRYTVAEIS